MGEDTDKLLLEYKLFFESNLKLIGDKIKNSPDALIIDFNDILSDSTSLADSILDSPEKTLQTMESAMHSLGLSKKKIRIRVFNIPDSSKVEIRNIRSKHIGNFIKIKGIVKRASVVRPKTTNIKFECPSCGTIISVLQMDKKISEPNRCSCGRRGLFKELSKDLIDFQGLVIEELPEDIHGAQPHKIKVYITGDLVAPVNYDKTIPGKEVEICGVLKEVPIITNGAKSTEFDLAIEGNTVTSLEEEKEENVLSEEDLGKIKELSKEKNILEKITNSIAPSICGHHDVKAALAFQLFGGVRSIKKDGTSRRGDIHILLVGDPGVAKSVILNFGHKVTPKSRFVSGKATSTAGLIAGVTKDELSGGWSLEAGAMVLASGSTMFADEFEKMSEDDRSSMHQAMEQQEVNISKVSIQAKLRTRTAIFAAANPKYGRFLEDMPLNKQINLVPSLLSRFDMIIIMRDTPREDRDSDIADKILEIASDNEEEDIIEQVLLKKYISYARSNFNPKLTSEPAKIIKNYYVKMRKINGDRGSSAVAIGTRQLEGMIRFSQSHAKMRLSNVVENIDAIVSIKTMSGYLAKMGFDDETGQFDIDMIASTPSSTRGKLMFIRSVVSLIRKRDNKYPSAEDITKETGSMDIDEVYELLITLKQNGELFEPNTGYYGIIMDRKV